MVMLKMKMTRMIMMRMMMIMIIMMMVAVVMVVVVVMLVVLVVVVVVVAVVIMVVLVVPGGGGGGGGWVVVVVAMVMVPDGDKDAWIAPLMTCYRLEEKKKPVCPIRIDPHVKFEHRTVCKRNSCGLSGEQGGKSIPI